MIFLDPKSDIAFKKLFGDGTHKNIVISFLNSVLNREEGAKIVDVIINDPNNLPETRTAKSSIVDVRCTDQNNNHYIIEMQVVAQADYTERAQYYNSLGLSRQLASGDYYGKLVPVIFVGILDFNLFKKTDYISHHHILDIETHEWDLKNLEWHFVELKKFSKQLDELTTILDKWIYFLKHAVTLQQIPSTLKDPVLEEAFSVLAQSNWTIAELEAYDRYLDAIRSSGSQLDTAKMMGKMEGKIEGKMEGKIEGKMEEKIVIAKKLLAHLHSTDIAQITGLSIEVIENLKKN